MRTAAVWTWAANPWWEAMAEPPPGGPEGAGGPAGGATRRPGGWRRFLAWLIEYHRY